MLILEDDRASPSVKTVGVFKDILCIERITWVIDVLHESELTAAGMAYDGRPTGLEAEAAEV